MMTIRTTLSSLAIPLAPAPPRRSAFAVRHVTFSDVGWTDITATTAATTAVLDALGYETDVKVLSVPVTYTSLAEGDIDVFLGNWMPTMEADIAPYREAGTVDTVRANLEGAKYTLATNAAGAALGIDRFATSPQNAEALDDKIYGIEPGNDGNRLILDMIEADAFGLPGFESWKAPSRACWRRSPRIEAGRADRLPRLGAAPDERQFRPDLPRGRRRLLRPRFRRRHGGHQYPRGLCRRMPEHRQASPEPGFHARMENEIMGAILMTGPTRPRPPRHGSRQSRHLEGWLTVSPPRTAATRWPRWKPRSAARCFGQAPTSVTVAQIGLGRRGYCT